ncbi:hypothetical protein D8S82_30315 [Mycobacterium hodleri]|uniref:Major capsid protein E n=1 Tax=Mycolicibacterium hodleri TaxID=49897 RepID=A0A544VS61_9MYCO|nr:major capsid protein [Mycolicibacterium hodleri]TQR82817.1 hypothetical protein D8S82_30315 [Mycolicibacterium hodleri]
MPALMPDLTGRTLSVDIALKQPSLIQARIAKLLEEQLLVPKLLRQLGAPVTGGGLAFYLVHASDFYSSDVSARVDGAEYGVVEGVDPEPRMALVEDWGGKFQITDAQISRNAVNYLDQQTTQLVNTISKKIDSRAVAKMAAAGIGMFTPATGWGSLKFVGPLDQLTESNDRPTAHWAEVQEMADLEELGVKHDLLIVHPEQAKQLKTAYGPDLDAALESAGFTNGLFSNPRVPQGVAWTVEQGAVGTIGWESAGLVVDVIDDRHTRSKWVQAYAVPAIAIDRPYAAKQITGLST